MMQYSTFKNHWSIYPEYFPNNFLETWADVNFFLHIHLVRLDKYKKENRKFWINDKDGHLDKQVHDIMHACNFCILRHKNKGNFITVTLDFVWSIHGCWFMIMDKFSIFIYCLCSSHLNQCCIKEWYHPYATKQQGLQPHHFGL